MITNESVDFVEKGKYYSIMELAEKLNMSRHSCRKLIENDKIIKAKKVISEYRISKKSVEKYLGK